MTPKASLATVAAVALLAATSAAGSALAGDNAAWQSQDGLGNSARIDQTPGSRNRAGTDALAARQQGDANILQFTQSSDRNAIGTGGAGFLQQWNRNTATVTQSSNRNTVTEIVQTGLESGTGTRRANTLLIDQRGGAANRVDSVVQTRTGLLPRLSGNEASILQDGAGNRVSLLSQTGLGNSAALSFDGDFNLASSRQSGAGNSVEAGVKGSLNIIRIDQQSLALGNTARIDVDGNANAVSVDQDGANAARIDIDGNLNRLAASQSGAGNALHIAINGHGNNALPVFSLGAHRGFAAAAGLAPGDVVQNGLLNSIDYTLGGGELSSGNRFALAQDGIANRIEGTTDGIGNEVVVVQEGARNLTSFVQIGNFNVIGVSQQ